MSFPFNIRVYGILIDHDRVLLSDEMINGKEYTKFPGGGLEFGEGTRDCLKREFLEEMNLSVEIGSHFYTTDYFQPSVFGNREQIISIYYYVVAPPCLTAIATSNVPLFRVDRNNIHLNTESYRFMPVEQFSEQSVTLPIDKVAARLLKETFMLAK
ncbi:NUDIX domain-containing protein [Haoranjiania flava]|uniref:NUDIX domain-containing protein n=1 Tax=Haoranjiania flava TaxID=1856322 RepID=A0AAE3IQG2_9BACT|nr:NUDIX domain-containing protein [Haoranjiania flava]MCU7694546.1 NUDIX domain-containing protein [Haoranjiania flava]